MSKREFKWLVFLMGFPYAMQCVVVLVIGMSGCSARMAALNRLDALRVAAVSSCKVRGQCPVNVDCINAIVAATGTLDGLAEAVKAAESGPCKQFVSASKP